MLTKEGFKHHINRRRLITAENRFKVLNRFNAFNQRGKLFIYLYPYRQINIININRGIIDMVINYVKSNIDTINITYKFWLGNSIKPMFLFFGFSKDIGKRRKTYINRESCKNSNKQCVNKKNKDYKNMLFSFAYLKHIYKDVITNKQDNKNRNRKFREFKEKVARRVKEIFKHRYEPPFKNVSNQGGDGCCNYAIDNLFDTHNATSKGFCQLPLSPFYYSPAGVA